MARSKPFLIAATLALVLAGAALADQPVIKLTAPDQAAAKAIVLKMSDFGTGWTGGARKPDLSATSPCPNFNPKQSDLVTTGAAETDYGRQGVDVDSEVQILKTSHMVSLDWSRTFTAQLIPCLRSGFTTSLPAGAKLISLKATPFPHVAKLSGAYRAVVEVRSGTKTARIVSDLVFAGKGRAEVTLTVTAPAAAGVAVHALETQFVRLMASRVNA